MSCEKVTAVTAQGGEERAAEAHQSHCVRGHSHTAPEGSAHIEGTSHMVVDACAGAGRGRFLSSPIIVPIAEGSHRNGESLPDWV